MRKLAVTEVSSDSVTIDITESDGTMRRILVDCNQSAIMVVSKCPESADWWDAAEKVLRYSGRIWPH